jgi:hypothetical protein
MPFFLKLFFHLRGILWHQFKNKAPFVLNLDYSQDVFELLTCYAYGARDRRETF